MKPHEYVVLEISRERERQIEKEGYDSAHDDAHSNGEIALAACCYASPEQLYIRDDRANAFIMRDPWPWEERFDKRRYDGNRVMKPYSFGVILRRDLLIKAAALLVAEIEREDRATGKTQTA